MPSDEERRQQIREQVDAKVKSFVVGDIIEFSVYDNTGCTESTGDPVEVKLIGKILSIKGQHAQVEHKYGVCSAWLAIANKVKDENL